MPEAARPAQELPADRMRCMEVWGGNQGVNRAFEVPGLNVWIFARPYLQAENGGDVYYVSSCASGRITRLLLADVSGHGPLVSGLATSLRDLMRNNVNMIKQSRLVQAMNRQFADVSQQGGFATALVSTFFAPTRSLALCTAGHPAPLVYRSNAKTWDYLHQQQPRSGTLANTPLGVTDEADYLQTEIHLQKNDRVLYFSDALNEAQNRDGKQLGMQGLRDVVRGLETDRPEALVPDLLEAVNSLHPGNLDEDDLTVMLIEATGTKSTVKDNLLAPFRLLRPANDATELV